MEYVHIVHFCCLIETFPRPIFKWSPCSSEPQLIFESEKRAGRPALKNHQTIVHVCIKRADTICKRHGVPGSSGPWRPEMPAMPCRASSIVFSATPCRLLYDPPGPLESLIVGYECCRYKFYVFQALRTPDFINFNVTTARQSLFLITTTTFSLTVV